MGLLTNNFTTKIGPDPYTTEIPREEEYNSDKQLALGIGCLIISIALCLNGLCIWSSFEKSKWLKIGVFILGVIAIVFFIQSMILFFCNYNVYNQISIFSIVFLLLCCLLIIPSFGYTVYKDCCDTSNRI